MFRTRDASPRKRMRPGFSRRRTPVFTTPAVIATLAVAALLGGGVGYLAAHRTIRGLRAELADAAWNLAHDPLTGLLNRAGLLAAYATIAASPQPILAILIDLDKFKAINDEYGHDAGDTILTEVADRIAAVAALHGGAGARLSGDEFAAVLPARSDDLPRVAETFGVLAAQPIQINTGDDTVTINVTVSIGLTLAASTDAFEEVTLHRADVAMYHAKSGGGNQHAIYVPGMTMPTTKHRRGPRLRDRIPAQREATA